MKRILLLTFASLLLFSCDSKFIDDIFTFNIERSSQFTLPAGTPAGMTQSLTVPIPINDSVLSANGTSASLLKSAKLTKLQVLFSDPYKLSDVDTLELRISSASQPSTLLGYYYSGMDSVKVTNVDFAPMIKDANPATTMKIGLKTSPSQDVITTINYTFTITAHPF